MFEQDVIHLLNARTDPRVIMATLLDAALDVATFAKRVESEILPMLGSPKVHPARELAALTQHTVACHLAYDPDLCMSQLERLNMRLVELAISKGWTASASTPRDAELTSYPCMGTMHPKEMILAYRKQ
jgi:hypothetical protein